MRGARFGRRTATAAILGAFVLSGVGCFHERMSMMGPDVMPGIGHGPAPITVPPPGTVPVELNKVILPPYVVEAPDNLLIEVVTRGPVPVVDALGNPRTDPKDPTKTLTQDGTMRLPVQPVSGPFQVRPDGSVNLGFWGSVTLSGLSLDQASEAIRRHLLQSKVLTDLGLDKHPENLVVIVDVLAYNSKRYYVITDGGGYGEQVFPFPITGSETVLDALSNIYGLPSVASRRNIWVARRSPHTDHPWQILPVDWVGITQHGVTVTNYQIMPGDRIYVKAQKIITFDTALSRAISPIERILGVTLLGANTVNQIKGNVGTNGQ
jgi:polysaccharide export outer membrane protein